MHTQWVEVGGPTIIADELPDMGGDDIGLQAPTGRVLR